MTLYSVSVVINKQSKGFWISLDFCFDERMLYLYRKLCRYYYHIDAEATVGYVNAYRDMWDERKEINRNNGG